ncbi:MAG: protein kinase [Blastocatellia bacterium]|nr:protein kinase [Blastocatellia bacterium]
MQQIEAVFHDACNLAPDERTAFIAQACAGDEDLRREVEALLTSDEQAGPLIETPAYQMAAPLLLESQSPAFAAQSISHYQIIALLGQGGMGEVYQARDTRLDRTVALKILPADVATNSERLRRFVREAKAASALNHPHVATIYEIGEAENVNFIAMEYVEGQTLAARINGQPLAIQEVVDIGLQIADALDEAHCKGIIHRDIKSANVMLTPRRQVKVLDFGLAKIAQPQSIDSDISTLAKTQSGVVMGTVPYMSPEQALGRAIDHRSDLFSLGVVVYEMVTGRLPFSGSSTGETLDRILHSEPEAMAQFNRDVPVELERIVNKALRKDREQRYQTSKELLFDLQRLQEELKSRVKIASDGKPEKLDSSLATWAGGNQNAQVGDPPSAPTVAYTKYLIRKIKQHKRVLLAVFIVAGITFGVYQFIGQRQSPPATSPKPMTPSQTMEMRKLTNTGNITTAAISPDGKYVAYTQREGGQQSLWLRQVAITSNVQIVPPTKANFTGLTFSPDGNYLYYVEGSTLYQMPVLGGATRKLIADVGGPVTFSPDGVQLAFVRNDPGLGEARLIRASADGSGEQILATRKRPAMINLESAAWSPSGEVIVVSTLNADAEGSYNSVVAVRAREGTETTITSQRWRHVPSLAWLSDASGLVMIARDRASAAGSPYQVWHLSYPGGEARRITNDLQGYRSISLTADARSLITVQEDQVLNLWVTMPGKPTSAKQIAAKLGLVGDWTPDGKILLHWDLNGNRDIWLTDPDGSGKKQLTVDTHSDVNPKSSFDGRYIVFTSFQSGSPNIWRMDSDGTHPKRLTSGKLDDDPAISPDDKWVVYKSGSSGKTTLWKVPIDSGAPVQITNKYSEYPVISPDGKLIACRYKDEPASPTTIAIIPFEGGEPIKTFDLPISHMRWTTDARALTFIVTRAGVSNLWNQPLAGGPPKQLTNFQAETIHSFAWSRDGKRLALVRGVINNDVVLIRNFR